MLKPTGTMYLHCDWHANAHLRLLMDRIGPEQFRNEIVWCYAGGDPEVGLPEEARQHLPVTRRGPRSLSTRSTAGTGTGRRTTSPGQPEFRGAPNTDRGTPVNDWWADLKHLTSYQREHMGYPTQKPEALLERIIRVSSNPGILVLDPFCGCGTAIAVAQKTGRRWIGIDVSPSPAG